MPQKPRVRISSKAYQQSLKPKRRPRPATFTVRQALLKATRRQRNRRAAGLGLLLHVIGLFWLVYTIQPTEVIEDAIHVEMINQILEKRKVIKQKPPEVKPIVTETVSVSEQKLADTTVKVQTSAAHYQAPAAVDIDLDAPDALPSDTLTTDAHLPATSDIPAGTTQGTQNIAAGRGGQGVSDRHGGNARRGFGGGKFKALGSSTGQGDATHTPDADLITKVDDDKLGAVLEGNPFELRGHIRIIRLKHSLSDWWQDPSAIPSFAKWLQENTQLRACLKSHLIRLGLTQLVHKSP